jgi:hypothetical protein
LDDADALRVAIWRAGAAHPDEQVRTRFVRRYPDEASFDRWALKEFLALNPEAKVFGIDQIPALPAAPTVRDVAGAGARQPDDDKRNQARFAHDDDRVVRRDPWGQPLPADPAQLNMGGLIGTSSQAHAHYGLPKLEFSDSPDVLKKDPRRFAYPPTARAFAADFTQLYTDLAICAATMGREGGPALGWLYLSNGHHYLQDVANQIHTLQAIYGFFYDAKIESYKQELFSMGGLFRSRPDFVTIGIGIIKNHHLLAEDLFAKRVAERRAGKGGSAGVGAALDAIGAGDGALEQALDARKPSIDDPFGRVVTEEVIEASSREGGEVYELIRGLTRKKLSRAGGSYDSSLDPDAFLRKNPDQKKLDRFYHLQAVGFGRAGSALRRHVNLYLAAVETARASDEARQARFLASAHRLVATQVAYLDDRDARLAAYKPKAPAAQQINWFVPGGTLALVLAIAALVRWRIRARRRRAAAASAPAR